MPQSISAKPRAKKIGEEDNLDQVKLLTIEINLQSAMISQVTRAVKIKVGSLTY